MPRVCSIEGCDKRSRRRSWCAAHYHRWHKHGDPLAGGTAWGEPERFYREVVLTDERGVDDPCLAWPYADNGAGYGVMSIDGHMRLISRLACEEAKGPPPTPKHDAAHNCGRGGQRCVTKSHLDWKTPKENSADMVVHGTRLRGERNANAKLTEAEAREIWALKGKMTQQKIADLYGVDPSSVSAIHRKRSWGLIHG